MMSYVSSDSDMELAYGVNYSKQLNAVLALQGGLISGGLSNSSEDTLSLMLLTLKDL